MPSGSVIRYDGARGVVWRMKYRDATGVQVMETVGAERDGMTERRARELLADRLSDVRRKGHRKPRQLTFTAYVDETWLPECKRRRGWKSHTEAANRGSVERMRSFFGPLTLGRIRPRDVAAYIAQALDHYAPATVNLDVNVLVDVFNSAIREELVETNPALLAERPKIPRRRWRILEPAEVGKVAKALADEQMRTLFLVLVLTGIRRFEAQALRWRDVDLVDSVLRVRDSKSEDGIRSIALSPALIDALAEHKERSVYDRDGELVFCHAESGGRLNAKHFDAALRAALAAAGVDGRVRAFHDLRHTAITNDAAAGANPIAVMTKAGHSDMKTTRRYMHLAGVVFRDEAAALEQRLLGGHAATIDLAADSSSSSD